MDRYLFNDILEYRSYLEWIDKISKVNKEYHDRYDFQPDGIECKKCREVLWNWRTECDKNVYRVYHVNNCDKYDPLIFIHTIDYSIEQMDRYLLNDIFE